MIIVLLGPPGAGKGTQGERLAARLDVPKIATGDVLRAAVRDGTPLGLEAKAAMDRGDLVPDDVIMGIMKEALASPAAAKGAILDGVVRTTPQADGVAAMLSDIGRKIDAVLLFDIAEDELVRRLSKTTGRVPEVCAAGPARPRKVAVITGGAGDMVEKVAAAGADTFITGEGPQSSWLSAEELGVNVIYGGHYATETLGVQALAAHLAKKFRVPWQFVDHPVPL